ncbi:MAG: hypothetical protein U0350_11035 [Caldilineaceae bacterium]
MPAVEIAQHWIDELAELQQGPAVNISDVVDVALKQYMFRQRQEKIAREQRWYAAHYSELAQQYYRQYVAIHQERLVDADPDGRALARRVKQQYGRVAIAIIQVTDSPEPPILYLRSPKLAELA